jgi:hypothetical protein
MVAANLLVLVLTSQLTTLQISLNKVCFNKTWQSAHPSDMHEVYTFGTCPT